MSVSQARSTSDELRAAFDRFGTGINLKAANDWIAETFGKGHKASDSLFYAIRKQYLDAHAANQPVAIPPGTHAGNGAVTKEADAPGTQPLEALFHEISCGKVVLKRYGLEGAKAFLEALAS